MGGYFSGRHGGQPTVEQTDSIRLDVSEVVPTRGRAPPAGMRFSGTRGGKSYSVIVVVKLDTPDAGFGTMRVWHSSIRHPTGGETGPQDYLVQMVAGHCTLGGRRWCFLCPRTGRRCRTLYLPNGAFRFWSRAAYRLAYQSPRMGDMDRCHARLARISRQAGGTYEGTDAGLPPRPKGMRRKTYDRLLEDWFEIEDRLDMLFVVGAARLLKLGPMRQNTSDEL